jgi:hypothetical protein
MSNFYKNWLNLWAWGVVLFGVILALCAFPSTEGPTRLFYEYVLGNPMPTQPDQHFRFAMGLMGCISVGWGLTFRAAFAAGHELIGEASRTFWRAIMGAAAIWFFTDSYVSIHTGFWRNAVSNSVLAVLFLIPLIRSGVLRGCAAKSAMRP